MDPATEQQAKEQKEAKGLRPITENIIPHLLNLYGSTATAQDFEIYAPNATFEDPLMRANGVKQIKSAFYSLSKVFSESKIVEYSIQENATAPGHGEILIDNKQHYKFVGRDIDLTTLIKLQIKDGKVVRHEDWWDKKPLKNRETVKLPLVGRLAEIARRGSMLATHAMMGCGKDPAPSNT
uniref:Peptide deformylase n=1 Tax=Anthurium amnicola TaxID=1678845 RepID=A0A1D1XHS2_9ARAE